LSFALAFLETHRPPDYGARLERLRWRRACGASSGVAWLAASPASAAVGRAAEWIVVLDASALPVFRSGPAIPAGKVAAAARAAPDGPAVHTLRELESSTIAASAPEGEAPPALAFRTADFPPRPGETVERFVERLRSPGIAARVPGFAAVVLDEPSERERPELTRRLPEGPLRILDAGCGAGAAIATAKSRRSGWTVTGIEWDRELARRARARCDRVLEGDLRRILPSLGAAGETFDALVFADVLEHLEDPVAALSAARAVAAPQARLLVSVPNAGHLSIARDLLAGRFDPVPAGLCDARHLRWFTRSFLAEAIAEAGWSVVAVEGEAGSPPGDAEAMRALASGWPEADLESLATYQWVGLGAAR
jgi:2-polyprenyl-3-methyl-5-hydroxy-6-metoxy-1,4-benzoquinol methylase